MFLVFSFFKARQFVLLLLLSLPLSSYAHLLMLYTPDLLRDKGGKVSLKMPFTHPAENGTVMKVSMPEQFFVVKKGKKKDLLDSVKKSEWTSKVGTGVSYEADAKLKGLGDNVFIVQGAPYYEEEEDLYIQQIAKTIVNVGGLPTDWNETLGLKAEIVPLSKPYAIYEGGTFSAVVKSEGKPVPFAEIEVEFVNYVPDMESNAFSSDPLIVTPSDAFITMTIFADANGTFNFAIPKAGQWGFAALGVGPDKEYEGGVLSQDAVIWVQAHPVVEFK